MSALGPRVAALAVAWRAGRVLLVRRANPPQAGHWGFPGGRVEWMETLFACAERELREETGLEATAEALMPPVEVVLCEREGHHFLLVPVRMGLVCGTAQAGDDATEVGWFAPEALPAPLCDDVAAVVEASHPAGKASRGSE